MRKFQITIHHSLTAETGDNPAHQEDFWAEDLDYADEKARDILDAYVERTEISIDNVCGDVWDYGNDLRGVARYYPRLSKTYGIVRFRA